MRNYIKPNMDIIKFNVENIITDSGVIVNASALSGEDATMYEVYKNNSSVKSENVSVFTW